MPVFGGKVGTIKVRERGPARRCLSPRFYQPFAPFHLIQVNTDRVPLSCHLSVLGPQPVDECAKVWLAGGRECGKEVTFFIFVMRGAGQVEIPDHVARGLTRRVVATCGREVFRETFEEAQRSCDAFVACGEHLERFVETRTGRSMQCQT